MDKLLSIETIATFTDIEPSINPSFHKAKTRIMAIESIANRCNFSKESVVNGLPTLKNVPIVTYFNEEGNLGDHEMSQDRDGKPIFKTYGIGVIPESAEQWIEEVEENGETKQYLCSDVLLWKRQKREYEFIQKHKELSVSMEVQITNSCFDENKILNIDEFYFTAVTVLGIGVNPAFDNASLTFSKQDDQIQEMMFDLKNFDGVGNMPQEENVVTEPVEEKAGEHVEEKVEVQEPEQKAEEPKEEVKETVKDEPNYKELLEKAEADYGRTIADLNKENDALKVQMESVRTELEGKVASLEEQLKSLSDFKAQVEQEQRAKAIEGVKERFSELAEDDEFKSLITDLESGKYTPEQAEDKCYAIIGRQAKAKRQSKVAPAPKVTINANHKEQPKAKDSKYGGLLFK